jgi:hypothetical protein
MATYFVSIKRVQEFVVEINTSTPEDATLHAFLNYSRILDDMEPTVQYLLPKEEWPIEVL